MGHDSLQLDTKRLLDWYDARRRILPWREDPTPYHVWVSEIMLQQTRVDAVIPYYRHFMETLPDVAALAAAPEEVCLKLWEGLGYYSRIRNMQKAARQVMDQFHGEIPGTVEQLEELSGIGRYTAQAIASIAFRVPVPSVDGNLLRVFARRTGYPENIKSSKALKAAAAYYAERIPKSRPGDFNQAVMDLGATVCLPNGEPLCDRCPWNADCQARAQGTQKEYPVMPPKKERVIQKNTVLLFRQDGDLVLEQRPRKGLLSGLMGFPMMEGHIPADSVRSLLKEHGIPVQTITARPDYVHIFSHREWHNRVLEITVDPSVPLLDAAQCVFPDAALLRATPSELTERYSLPTAFRPCIE